MDFAKLVEVFDRNSVTFVSVTQSFNTTTSMGRLTLNILLSFAQFEREVIGERIRDKFAASRKKGMWMGGFVPLGYDVKDRKLVVERGRRRDGPHDLRALPRRSARPPTLVRELRDEGVTRQARQARSTRATSTSCSTTASTSARPCTRARPIPASTRRSSARRSGTRSTPSCSESPRQRAARHAGADAGAAEGADLRADRRAMTPTHTRKGGKLYRYYVSTDVLKHDARGLPGAARAGRRDRERRHRPGARLAALAGDHRPHMARGTRNRWTVSAKPTCATRCSGSIRSGTNCSRPSRRGSSSCWSSGSTSPRTAPTSDCEMKG